MKAKEIILNWIDNRFRNGTHVFYSFDFENEISLSHNTSTVQTTMTFTNAPDSGVKITVDRGTDKYLVFRNKGI